MHVTNPNHQVNSTDWLWLGLLESLKVSVEQQVQAADLLLSIARHSTTIAPSSSLVGVHLLGEAALDLSEEVGHTKVEKQVETVVLVVQMLEFL
jgi:hypothetical protein